MTETADIMLRMHADFDALAVQQRRIILVASAEKYNELTRQIDWTKIGKLAVGGLAGALLAPVLFGAAAGSSYLTPSWLSPSTTDSRTWWERLTTKGEIPIPHLPPDEARRRYRFDPGQLHDGCAYLSNPCVPDHYLLPAIANERLAQEKLAAFIRIVAALGAKSVSLISIDVARTRVSGTATVPVEQIAGQLGAAVKVDSDGIVKRQVFLEFDEPETTLRVPPELESWLLADPALRALCQTRIQARVRRAQISLGFREHIDVGADACADLAGRAINVGGRYRAVHESVWNYEIDFWPGSVYGGP